MSDTILIDGTDIQTAARILKIWEGVHAGPEVRGSLLTYPLRDGNTDIDQPFGPLILSIGLVIRGGAPDVTGFNDAYRVLRRLCKPGRTVTLTKQLSYAGGNEVYTAMGKLLRISPAQLTPADYRVVVDFTVLDGLWYGPAVTIGTGAVTVLGDVRTRRMTITLSAGANPTLSTSVTGQTLTYTGSTATAVVIDVEAMTATQAGVDVSHNLNWNESFPFGLLPEAQTLACSSGTASIAYQPAYL